MLYGSFHRGGCRDERDAVRSRVDERAQPFGDLLGRASRCQVPELVPGETVERVHLLAHQAVCRSGIVVETAPDVDTESAQRAVLACGGLENRCPGFGEPAGCGKDSEPSVAVLRGSTNRGVA